MKIFKLLKEHLHFPSSHLILAISFFGGLSLILGSPFFITPIAAQVEEICSPHSPSSTSTDEISLFLSFQHHEPDSDILKSLLQTEEKKLSGDSSWSMGSLIPGWASLSHFSKGLFKSYHSYFPFPGKKSPAANNISEVLLHFPPELHFKDLRDIQGRSMEQFLQEEQPEVEGVDIEGVPFKVLQQVPIDLPVNPIAFENQNAPEKIQRTIRAGTSRFDLEGTKEIFDHLYRLIIQDPMVRKHVGEKLEKEGNKKIEEMIHLSLIGRIQGFDHPLYSFLFQRFQDVCPKCVPLFTNNQDKGQMTFAVKNGKLLVKTNLELLVREMPSTQSASSGLPVNHGSVVVDRMIVYDLLTGENSKQLIFWRTVK